MSAHVLYVRGDPDCPESILDRNGDVVLQLCRRCGRGEVELAEPCSINAVTTDPQLIIPLSRLAEEGAEIVKPAMKMLRFGLRPVHNGVQYDNVTDLRNEMIDAIRRMREAALPLGIDFDDVLARSRTDKPAPDDAQLLKMRWEPDEGRTVLLDTQAKHRRP